MHRQGTNSQEDGIKEEWMGGDTQIHEDCLCSALFDQTDGGQKEGRVFNPA